MARRNLKQTNEVLEQKEEVFKQVRLELPEKVLVLLRVQGALSQLSLKKYMEKVLSDKAEETLRDKENILTQIRNL